MKDWGIALWVAALAGFLKALDRHGGLVIPRVINKSAAFAERLIPRSVIAKLVARLSRPGPAS